MPKIDARTVAEHHDLQLSRLLDAALDFVADHPVESLTLAALAKRTGRSRASLYAYVGSTEELRTVLCVHALAAWVDELLAEVRAVADPSDRLDRLVGAQIRHQQDPAVERVLGYVLAQQGDAVRDRLREVTEPLTTELLAIIEHLGVAPPTRAATVVQGAIAAAHDQVGNGADPDEVAADTVAFVRAGLDALRSIGSRGGRGPAGGRSAGGRAVGQRAAVSSDGRARRSTPSALARSLAPARAPMPWMASTTAIAPMPPAAPMTAIAPMPPMASMTWIVATAMPATTVRAVPVQAAAVRPADTAARPARTRRARAARVAVAQLVWACVGFVSGITGVGGSVLHVALGMSLVAILVWSVRVLPPTRLLPVARRAAPVLAVAASAVAIVARAEQLEVAVVVHVVLAAVLLAGLVAIAAAAVGERVTA